MADQLLEEVNPNGNIQAVVEADGRTCYFYLYGAPETEFGMRSVWVRNLAPAPASLDAEAMRRGEAPLNPRAHCRNPGGSAAPSPNDLRIVWLPEGNGAVLYERNEIIAILPPWSDRMGSGYARDCIGGEGPLAWELTPDNALLGRFAEAERYWAAWDADPWPEIRDLLSGQIEAGLGRSTNYYAIDGGVWPPKALLRIPVATATALVTIGVSNLPQPNVEGVAPDPQLARRIELGAILPAHWPEQAIKRFGAYLSGQSKLPWTYYTWLGHGHTLPCDSWLSPRYDFALLVNSHPAVSPFVIGPQFSDPVSILWFLPISAAEQQLAETHGLSALLSQLPATRWQEA